MVNLFAGPDNLRLDYERLETVMRRYPFRNSTADCREVRGLWEGLVKDILEGKKQELLSLYLHVPFCAHRCKYCMYFSAEPEVRRAVRDYAGYLGAELEFMAPAFRGVKFTHFYLGGGTPNILTPRQLDGLLASVFKRFEFKSAGERCLECHPFSMEEGHLKVLRKYEFNRVSFGVQTLNHKTLRNVNRGHQTWRDIVALRGMLRRSGIPRLNIDLLFGLTGDTPAAFLASVRRVLELKPGQVTVHRLVPMPAYVKDFYRGDTERCVSDINKFAAAVLGGIKKLADAHGYVFPGYDPRSLERRAYTLATPAYMEEVYGKNGLGGYSADTTEPYSILGLGPSARSGIFGSCSYTSEPESPRKFSPEEGVYSLVRYDLKYEMLWHMVYSLNISDKISGDQLSKVFSTDVFSVFREPLKALLRAGVISVKGRDIHINSRENKTRFLVMLHLVRSVGG